MIMLQDFMDPYTFNQKTVMKCCKEILLPDGKQIPFCAYNSVGYREQVRAALTGVEVPGAVPNARELLPIVRVGTHGSKIAADAANGGPARASNVGRSL